MNPTLSIIITIVGGVDALREFLAALTLQADSQVEIVVPFDSTVRGIADLRQAFPAVIFLDLGEIRTAREVQSAAGQHELYDRRRAGGLAVGRGDLIAILEDRGIPRPDWVRTALRLHQRLPNAVIGGAIEARPSGIFARAVYLCDFSRYGLPFASGPAQWVSDVNVCYKRRALELTRDLWKERFHEPIVHGELMRQGETLYLSSELVVDHRRAPTPTGVLLQERFHWGRLYGAIRAGQWTVWQRLVCAMMGPFLPLLLLIRHGRTQFRKGHFRRYVPAIPAIALLLVGWTAGEVWGYLTRKG